MSGHLPLEVPQVLNIHTGELKEYFNYSLSSGKNSPFSAQDTRDRHRAATGTGRGHTKDPLPMYGGVVPTRGSLSSPSNHPVLGCPHGVPSKHPLCTP